MSWHGSAELIFRHVSSGTTFSMLQHECNEYVAMGMRMSAQHTVCSALGANYYSACQQYHAPNPTPCSANQPRWGHFEGKIYALAKRQGP